VSAERALWRLRPRRLLRRARGPAQAGRTSGGRTGARTGARGRLTPRARLALAVLVALLALLAGGWLWLRDSSLVSVDQVRVSGAAGPDAGQVRSTLVSAAHRMTTLHVSVARLRSAVAAYPVVADLKVSSQFPHGLRIRVIERAPVGLVLVGGRPMAVSADGMLLPDANASAALPTVTAQLRPGGARVTQPQARREVDLLGAAPAQLIARLTQVSTDPTHGLTAQLRGGPIIYFGDAGDLASKWTAVSEVLADPGSAGAAYIDATDPQRPAAGTGNGTSSSGSGIPSSSSGVAAAGAATTGVAATGAATTSATAAAASPTSTVGG
jgi:cell division protein FtsQ